MKIQNQQVIGGGEPSLRDEMGKTVQGVEQKKQGSNMRNAKKTQFRVENSGEKLLKVYVPLLVKGLDEGNMSDKILEMKC